MQPTGTGVAVGAGVAVGRGVAVGSDVAAGAVVLVGTGVSVGGREVFVTAGGILVADGPIKVEVEVGLAVVVAVPPGRVLSGVGVEVEVEDPPSVTVWVAVSEIVFSMVSVKAGALTLTSPAFLMGVLVIVKVALDRKGVSVAVPPRSFLTIFTPGLQAAADQVKRIRIPSRKEKRFRIMDIFHYIPLGLASYAAKESVNNPTKEFF